MRKTEYIFVVEGINDTKKLKELNKNIITYETNGLGITNYMIEEIKKLQENFNIVLLLDPDGPGDIIRKRLSSNLKNPIHIFASKKDSIKNNKVGIENLDIDTLNKLLDNKIVFNNKSKITKYDLFELKLMGHKNSKELRNKLSNYLNIGFTNSKRLLERLKGLGLEKNDIERIINDKI